MNCDADGCYLHTRLYKLNLKHKFDSVVTTILFSLCGFSGCVTLENEVPLPPLDSNESEITYDLPQRDEVIAQPVTPLLQRSGGLAFSEQGTLFFANHEKSGTIGKYQLDKREQTGNLHRLVRVDFLFRRPGLESRGPLLIAEAGTGKLIRVSPDARKIGNIGRFL